METVIEIIFSNTDLHVIFRSSIAEFIDDFWLWLTNDIPFILLAVLIRLRLYKKEIGTKAYKLQLIELIIAWSVTFIFILWVNLEIRVGIVFSLPGSSTNAIGYYFLPYWGVIVLMMGYGFGWFVGKLVLKFK